jgi:hypothetical protein
MNFSRHLKNFINDILFSDAWGWLRFVATQLVGVAWGVIYAMLFETKTTISAFILQSIRYALIFYIMVGLSFLLGGRYIQDIYEIYDGKDALAYLWRMVFGFRLPRLKIVRGRTEANPERFNSIEWIGGPGKLDVEAGNAVILETLQAHTRVLGHGLHKISRFEKIKDIISLEEQYGDIEEITALTSDGIEVLVRDIQYRFQVDALTKDAEKISNSSIYAFSRRAVINLAYQRAIGANHQLSRWTDAVQGVIKSIIVEHISNNELDALVAPHYVEGHPLDELRSRFNEPKTRNRLKGMGAKLISCNIGDLVVKSADIDAQHVRAWIARKEGVARVIRAQGESENFASQERGRAEGQAMLLRSIAQALQEIELDGNDGKTGGNATGNTTEKNLRSIMLARTAQILESRTSIYQTNEEDKKKHDHKR